jgi:predicted ABC-type ATPase
MPEFYLFGGSNGAGKTTFALNLLPELGCRQFVNADEIARALSPFEPEAIAVRAGMLMMKRLRQLALNGENFASESTLAARAWIPFIEDIKTRGYAFNLIYIWLPSADLAVERVRARVLSGGHDIPEETIRRRYEKGLENLRNLYLPLAQGWRVYDNSGGEPRLIAFRDAGRHSEILDQASWIKVVGSFYGTR